MVRAYLDEDGYGEGNFDSGEGAFRDGDQF